MTNSTDKSEEKPVKKKKAKGPIRFEAIIPAFIVFALIAAYGHFFFDNHLRKGVEWTASYVHGAEVNVGKIKTSLYEGSLEVFGIQVTDKENPEQNLISVGKLRFKLLWDAILRMKFVVQNADIEQISIYEKRKKKGWVRPPSKDPKKAAPIEQLEANALAQLQEDNNENILGDVAQVAGGVDENEILKNIQGQLQAEKKIAELEKALKEKEAEWKKRISELPQKQEFESIAKRAKGLKFDAKDPREFAKDLKSLNNLVEEADSKINQFEKTGKGLKSDVRTFDKEISSIDDLIKKDIEDIEKRLKIPKIDGGNFSKSLFMRMVADKLVSFQKYAQVAREYMPPPKSEKAKEAGLVPRQRGEGENVTFKRTKGYPIFWLQKAVISSKATEKGFSGNIEGALTHVTNNQKLTNEPTLLSFQGGFPQQQVTGISGLVTVDHRSAEPIEKLDMAVGHFPVKNMKLSDSSDVKLRLTQAKGESRVIAELKEKAIEMKLWNTFTEPQYELTAENKIVSEVIDSVIKSIPKISVNAVARGSLEDIDLDIDSNLGKELSAGFSRYVKEKTAAIKAKIRTQIQDRVAGEKKKLNAEFEKLRSGLDKTLASKKQEVEKIKNEVKQTSQNKADASKDEIKDDLKKKGKELLKKLKF